MKIKTMVIAGIILLASQVSAKVRTVVPSLILEESTQVVTIKNFNSKKDPFKATLRINGTTLTLTTTLRADKRRADIVFPDLVADDEREVYGLLTLSGKGNTQEQLIIIGNRRFVDSTGPQGSSGPQGNTGATGPAGATGSSGSTGPRGSTGITGATGSQGSAGPIGPTGAQGLAGVNGENGLGIDQMKINSDDILLVKYTDGSVHALGTVVGDKGDQGDNGEAGPQGPRGPAGSSGNDSGFEKGFVLYDHPNTPTEAIISTVDNVVIRRLNVDGQYKGDWGGEGINTDPLQVYREELSHNTTNMIFRIGDDFEGPDHKVDTLKLGANRHQDDTFHAILEVSSDNKVRIPSLKNGLAQGKVLTTDEEGNLILVSFNSNDEDDDCRGNNGNDKPVGQGKCNSNK